jgi:hypothetical protein
MEFIIEYQFFLYATLAGFISAFFRSIQSKNVQANLKFSAFGVGWFMGLADAASIAIVANNGFVFGVFTGLGIGLGYVAGMVTHDRLMRKRRLIRKKEKRAKLYSRIRKVVKQLDDKETKESKFVYLDDDQIVHDITENSTQDEMESWLEIAFDDLIELHHTTGQAIRNEYRLWDAENPHNKNRHPDDRSMEIIKRVWQVYNADNIDIE